jgi:cysteine desulfurase
MWANNETGVIFPVAEAAALAHERGALFHTDAVQAVGRLPVDVAALPVDMLSLSGHKLHAPAGVGALFVRQGLRLPALLHGQQERGRRGGSENIAGIAALGAACAGLTSGLAARLAQVGALRDRLESGVLARLPYARVNGAGAERLMNTSNVRFCGLDAELILARLDQRGICASAGSACAAAGSKPSHVLLAMGLSAASARSSVRFSLGQDNTGDEIAQLLCALTEVCGDLARQSA